ncbi:MAG TPA: ribosomal RNA small subunit methyltransferase A [Deltaproteobacteria bacterium]|nr:ribosomal RNA small subunit methyltransferase A [Deltaproteobacteria bacterium]
MQPKKQYGQHFLVNQGVVDKIARLASLSADDLVVEIGPGTGVLTERLLESGATVIAIEIDSELVAFLKERFSSHPNFTLLQADALRVDFKELSHKYRKKIKVVSNLPYNISGAILFRFVDQWEAFDRMVLTLQREVVERITARCGTKAYGVLTVVLYAYGEVKREFNIMPGSFRPQPKVVSTVFTLKMREAPLVERDVEPLFRKVVNAAFSKRRKTIYNALKALVPQALLKEALEATGILPTTRPDGILPEEYIRLSTTLYTLTKGAYN